jgi:hypothetical protein
MVPHFSIRPSPSLAVALPAILARAHDDPWIAHFHPAPVHYLVFCASLDHSRDLTARYQRGGGEIDTEMAVLEIDPSALHVDQDCDEPSRRRMEAFVRWIFETFGPCSVIDHDSTEGERDVSLLASRNPGALF